MGKFSVLESPRWPPVLKIAKPMKSTFSPERLGIFGFNLAWLISENLVFKNIKMKICSGDRLQ